MKSFCLVATLLAAPSASAFSSVLFHEAPTLQRSAPSKHAGVDIELPDFNELFHRIEQVSPLARDVVSRNGRAVDGPKGFAAVDATCKSVFCALAVEYIRKNKSVNWSS